MPEIVVIGGGGHAKVVLSVLKKITDYNIIGYTDKSDKGTLLGIEYLGDDTVLTEIKREHSGCNAVIAVGSMNERDVRTRNDIYRHCEDLGLHIPAIISPAAVVNEGVDIESGTVILDGVIVNTGTKIGKCCIINTNSSLDHDCTIGDHVHIAPGSTLSGGVRIGDSSLIGTGAAIIQNITVVNNCTIGAGAVVVDDCMQSGTYVGAPARLIR